MQPIFGYSEDWLQISLTANVFNPNHTRQSGQLFVKWLFAFDFPQMSCRQTQHRKLLLKYFSLFWALDQNFNSLSKHLSFHYFSLQNFSLRLGDKVVL